MPPCDSLSPPHQSDRSGDHLESNRRKADGRKHQWNSRQFAYEKFVDCSGNIKDNVTTHSERYREAVRATHLIASELAEIEGPAEFNDVLRFMMTQWRNVRQKKIAVEIPEHVMDNAAVVKEKQDSSNGEVKLEFDISSSDDNSFHSESPKPDDVKQTTNLPESVVTIRLNPKARKVGAPKKMKKKIVAGERSDRKWYEAAEQGRKKAGDVTLLAVVDSLDRGQPSLCEVERRLSGVIVKYADADKKKTEAAQDEQSCFNSGSILPAPYKAVGRMHELTSGL